MKFCTTICFIFITWHSQAQWGNCTPINYRNWNSIAILDNNTAFIAGGNARNDSIRDIGQTTDGAISWHRQFEQLNFWFKSLAFPDPGKGITVGNSGTIQKTLDQGASWTAITAPGATAGRDFNSIFFVNSSTGYIIGGRQRNDSVQTILKTIDGGEHWSIQRDAPGHWLNSVFFVDVNAGFAVGEQGVILKTTDGGANWNAVTLTGNMAARDFNSIYFLDSSTGFITGGHPANDSIQTILKTTDGGNNWNIVIDRLGPMLNALDFATAAQAYVVGNYGVAYNSIDSGNTWTTAALPAGGPLDTMDLNAVKFLNADFGIAAGKTGRIVKYISPTVTVPVLTTLSASNVGNTGAQLNMRANASGYLTNLSFEYGTSISFGNSIAVPATLSGNISVADSVILTGLIPNTFYYYRAKGTSQNGISYGATVQFYTTECEIPNCDLEIWDPIIYEIPEAWHYNFPLSRVSSYNGSFAVQLGPGGGALILATPESQVPAGGFPFTARPDSIKMHANYDINTGDTAFIILLFKKGGAIFTQDFIPITGNSAGNWLDLSYPVLYTDTLTPDSLIAAVTSSNTFSSFPNSTSRVTVDDIYFSGTTDTLPNWNFERWNQLVTTLPAGWVSDRFKKDEDTLAVQKVADCVTGHSALALSSYNGSPRRIMIGDTMNYDRPVFPVAGKHLTLNMYLKFLQQAHDSLNISLTMYKGDTAIGFVNAIIDTPLLTYTPFAFDIVYAYPNLIPDSASLNFTVGSPNSVGSSVALIDNISFDGFRNPTVGIREPAGALTGFAMYPNPATGTVMIDMRQSAETELQLFDLTGKIVYQSHFNAAQKLIDIRALSPGIYLVKAATREKTLLQKLVVER